jgi:hypothetical protein
MSATRPTWMWLTQSTFSLTPFKTPFKNSIVCCVFQWSLSVIFSDQSFVWVCNVTHAYCMPRECYCPWFQHLAILNVFTWMVAVTSATCFRGRRGWTSVMRDWCRLDCRPVSMLQDRLHCCIHRALYFRSPIMSPRSRFRAGKILQCSAVDAFANTGRWKLRTSYWYFWSIWLTRIRRRQMHYIMRLTILIN